VVEAKSYVIQKLTLWFSDKPVAMFQIHGWSMGLSRAEASVWMRAQAGMPKAIGT